MFLNNFKVLCENDASVEILISRELNSKGLFPLLVGRIRQTVLVQANSS